MRERSFFHALFQPMHAVRCTSLFFLHKSWLCDMVDKTSFGAFWDIFFYAISNSYVRLCSLLSFGIFMVSPVGFVGWH
jgi:hypothetical protein